MKYLAAERDIGLHSHAPEGIGDSAYGTHAGCIMPSAGRRPYIKHDCWRLCCWGRFLDRDTKALGDCTNTTISRYLITYIPALPFHSPLYPHYFFVLVLIAYNCGHMQGIGAIPLHRLTSASQRGKQRIILLHNIDNSTSSRHSHSFC